LENSILHVFVAFHLM